MERWTRMKPRIALPSLVWLVLAIASFVAALSVWQDQRIERMRPPASVAPAAPAAAIQAEPVRALAAPGQPAPRGLAPGSAAPNSAATPVRQLDPTAGRQVLRCVSKGRVTYRDLNAGCPEGASEKVTVFPTEGVGKPQ